MHAQLPDGTSVDPTREPIFMLWKGGMAQGPALRMELL